MALLQRSVVVGPVDARRARREGKKKARPRREGPRAPRHGQPFDFQPRTWLARGGAHDGRIGEPPRDLESVGREAGVNSAHEPVEVRVERADGRPEVPDVQLRVLEEEGVVRPRHEADAPRETPRALVELEPHGEPAPLRLGLHGEKVRVLAGLPAVRARDAVNEPDHLPAEERASREASRVRRGHEVARGRDGALGEAPGRLRDVRRLDEFARGPKLADHETSAHAASSSRAARSAALRGMSSTKRCSVRA